MKNDTVYVHSLGKRISLEEFLSYLPKVGEVVVLNKSNFIRRKEDTKEGNLNFEQLVCLKVTDGYANPGAINISYEPEMHIASSHLVNCIISGEYKVVDGKFFGDIKTKYIDSAYEQIKEVMNTVIK